MRTSRLIENDSELRQIAASMTTEEIHQLAAELKRRAAVLIQLSGASVEEPQNSLN
jgi:hypothetical protein